MLNLVQEIRAHLTDDLRKPEYQGNPNLMVGHCYVASEAVYHMLGGGKSGLKPMNMVHEGNQHWYLLGPKGVIDVTADQFRTPVPYEKGRGRGFLTAKPSKRATELIRRIRCKQNHAI